MSSISDKIYMPQISVIINNLCNMTCSHCAGLACFNFTGQQTWKDSQKRYERWAEILDVDEICFAGGETFLNPELPLWAKEFNKLWPNAVLEITSNGTRLRQRIDFVREFLQRKKNTLTVSVHEQEDWDKIKFDLETVLEPWNYYTTESDMIPLQQWRSITYKDLQTNRIIAKLLRVTEMHPPYYKEVKDGTIYLEMGGDQEKSHAACPWQHVYTFQEGLLYKCTLTTNYPEAIKQGRFETEADKLLSQYQPGDPFNKIEEVKKFVESLNRSIPQCTLCAFDKQHDSMQLSRTVNQDLNRKKAFNRNDFIPIKFVKDEHEKN